MADDDRTPRAVGKHAPASGSAKQQRMSGTKGGPQAGQQDGSGKQPPQTSGRRDPAHEHEGTVRKGYEAARDPEKQGDGDPGPDQIRKSSSLQGAGGSGGRGRMTAESAEAEAQAGEPKGEHTRHGRQKTPGDRDPQQPS